MKKGKTFKVRLVRIKNGRIESEISARQLDHKFKDYKRGKQIF